MGRRFEMQYGYNIEEAPVETIVSLSVRTNHNVSKTLILKLPEIDYADQSHREQKYKKYINRFMILNFFEVKYHETIYVFFVFLLTMALVCVINFWQLQY